MTKKFEDFLKEALEGTAKSDKVSIGGVEYEAINISDKAALSGLSALLEELASDGVAKRVRKIGTMTAEGVAKMVGKSLTAAATLDKDHMEASALYITAHAAEAALGMVAMACIPEANKPESSPENERAIEAKLNHNALLYAALVSVASETTMPDAPMSKRKETGYDPHEAAQEQFRILTGRYFDDTLSQACTCDECKAKVDKRRAFNAEADRAAAGTGARPAV